MKWASADVIRYHIVGVYQARTHIASDGSGQADVTDGLVIDLTWKLSESKLVAKPNANDMPTNTHTVESVPTRARAATCVRGGEQDVGAGSSGH